MRASPSTAAAAAVVAVVQIGMLWQPGDESAGDYVHRVHRRLWWWWWWWLDESLMRLVENGVHKVFMLAIDPVRRKTVIPFLVVMLW